MSKTSFEKGFTLVELAIVLMIIGLLIGGVLRGQELIANAQITSTIQQVKSYQAAYHSFLDTYSGYPGDMPNASARVPGCGPGNANFCGNGDGTGIIGITNAQAFRMMQSNVLTMPQVETTYFWKYLALAHLISGIDPSSNPTGARWGSTHPVAKIGAAGFNIFYSSTIGDWGHGHILRLQLDARLPSNEVPGQLAISPSRARILDQKMDDGLPDRGSVTADFESSNCDNGGVYSVSDQRNCMMYFQLN